MEKKVEEKIRSYFINKKFEIRDWVFMPQKIEYVGDVIILKTKIVQWGNITKPLGLAQAMTSLADKMKYFDKNVICKILFE
jgi:hypothetical protein